jgi:hypothetical protein
MRNKAIIILIVVAGFLAALYLMGYLPFGGEPEELNNDDFSIKSDDESAELFIPKGALSDNVDQDDISVTKASNIVTENGTWAVYELEPDGLAFKEEILFNVTLERGYNTLPIVIISNDNGIDLVNNIISEFDLDNHTQKVSIPLSHFSTIYIGTDTSAISLKVSAPRDVFLGDRVITIASFTFVENKLLLDRTDTEDGIYVYEFLEPYVTYKGTWTSRGGPYSIFTPDGEFPGKPGSTQVALGQTNTVQDDTFEVDAIENDWLHYEIEVTASVKITHYISESDYLGGKVSFSDENQNQKIVFFEPVFFISHKPELIIQGIYTTKHQNNPEIHMIVEIHGPANATGIVTLTGRYIEPMIQPVLIGPGGSTRNTFIHPFSGEITVFVEVGELNATRIRDFG